jgi:hypothetical protein
MGRAMGVAVGLTTTLLLVGAVMTVPRGRAGDVDRLSEVVAAAEARIAASQRDRKPVQGEAIAGKAWLHYRKASQLLGDRTFSWNRTHGGLSTIDGKLLVGERLASVRDNATPVLMEMSAGARCRDASRTREERGTMGLCWLALGEVRLRLLEGQLAGAVELWLDAATAALDGDGHLDSSMWRPAVVGALAAAETLTLLRGIERLDARLQPTDLEAVLSSYARPLLAGDYGWASWHWPQYLQAWEHGFDPTARHSAAFSDLFEHLHSLAPSAAAHADRDEQWTRWIRTLPASSRDSFLVDSAIRSARSEEFRQRDALRQLRTLQVGLHANLGGPLPTLIDPFSGEPLRIEQDGEHLTVHPTGPYAKSVTWLTRP